MNYGKRGTKNRQKQLTRKSTQYKGKVKVIMIRLALLAIVLMIGAAAYYGFSIYRGVIDDAPSISSADVTPSGFTTFVVDQDGNELERFVAENANRVWCDIESVPQYTQDAFVAIEDSRYYEHNGIDLQGIARAAFVGLTSGNFSEGASTITQQLIKNTIFTNFVNESTFKEKLTRKLQEQYLALQLEREMDKSQILENYLNTINLGQNCLGIQTAATRYFGKAVSDLTISESAVIASITQNPSKFNPISHAEDNAERRQKVLDNMLEMEFITQEEYDEACADDVYDRIQQNNAAVESIDSNYSYYIDELTEQVITDLQEKLGYSYTQAYNTLYSGGLTIVACQDETIQQIVDEEMNDDSNYPYNIYYTTSYAATVTHADGTQDNYYDETMEAFMKEINGSNFKMLFGSQEQAQVAIDQYRSYIVGEGDTIVENASIIPEPQASVVIMDQYTGEVKAISGGRGEKTGSLTLNRATNTVRQPGSCFKVLSTFAPALDSCGYTLASMIEDAPFSYENGRQVKNWYGSYWGATSVRKAITMSMNVVTVKVLTDITPRVGYNYLQNFGFTTLVDNWQAGDGTVYTDVQQALALGGITKGITNLEITAAYATIANGGVYTKPRFYSMIYDHDGEVLIDNQPETHRVLRESTAALLTSAMIDVVTKGTGTTANLPNMQSAGKTGTTTNDVDIWHCAYTPYYTCSVWGGFDDNTSMIDTNWHMVLWRSIMYRVSDLNEYTTFEMPDCVQYGGNICTASGKKAIDGCPTGSDWFAIDNLETCDGKHRGDAYSYEEEEEEEEEDEEDEDGEDDGGVINTDPSGGGDSGGDSGGGSSGGSHDHGGGSSGGGDTGGGDSGGGDSGGGDSGGDVAPVE